MSWRDPGKDSTGRPFGWDQWGECDDPGCTKKITRGLAHVCGILHGADEYSCELYFCQEHRSNVVEDPRLYPLAVCDACFAMLVVDSEGRIEGHKHFGIEGRT